MGVVELQVVDIVLSLALTPFEEIVPGEEQDFAIFSGDDCTFMVRGVDLSREGDGFGPGIVLILLGIE